MTRNDWFRVIDEASAMGTPTVQLIGGEPTLHADLTFLIEHASRRGLEVEVFTNLVSLRDPLWDVLERCRVRLATSYYSTRAGEHDGITGRRGSHDRTLANIREAVRRGLQVRAGVIVIEPGQDVRNAEAELRSVGVVDIRVDVVRRVGRGGEGSASDVGELCGACADGCLAVTPSGVAYPCVFSRWLPVGDVQRQPLRAVDAMAGSVRVHLREEFEALGLVGPCPPHDGGCRPAPCPPIICGPRRGLS